MVRASDDSAAEASPLAAEQATGSVAVTVARGRTVVESFGLDELGQPKRKSHSPGATLTMDAAEAKRLMKLGYLVDPEGTVPSFGTGPSFNREDGATVRPSA